MITEPGFYSDLSAEAYHADPCPEPSLSSGIARLLIEHSPMHARHAHPRLNPEAAPRTADHLDLGDLFHQLALAGEAAVEEVEAESWQTKAARQAKAEARAAGLVPILARQWERVRDMVRAFERQGGPDLLGDGRSELTLAWREPAGCWCRARADRLRDDGVMVDLKTTSGSAQPDRAGRRLFEAGYDVQAAFYRRGYETLTGRPLRGFIFVFVEVEPPHALSALEIGSASTAMAGRMVDAAIELWSDCLSRGRWPGYDGQLWLADAPKWREDRWIAREQAGEAEPAMAVALSRPLERYEV